MALAGEMKLGNVALTAAICLYLRSEGLEPTGDVRWGTQKVPGSNSDERENVAFVEVRTGERPDLCSPSLLTGTNGANAIMNAVLNLFRNDFQPGETAVDGISRISTQYHAWNEIYQSVDQERLRKWMNGETAIFPYPDAKEAYEALCDLLSSEREPGEGVVQTGRRLLRELQNLRFQIQRLSVPDPVGDLLKALPKLDPKSGIFWVVLPSLLADGSFEPPQWASVEMRRGTVHGSVLVASRYVSLAVGEREEVLATARRMLSEHGKPLEENPEWQEIERDLTSPANPLPVSATEPVPDEPKITDLVDPMACDNCGKPTPAQGDPSSAGWTYVADLDYALFCPECYAALPDGAKTPGEVLEREPETTPTTEADARVFTEAPGPELTERLRRDYKRYLPKVADPKPAGEIPDQVPCVAALHEEMKDGMQRAATEIVKKSGRRSPSPSRGPGSGDCESPKGTGRKKKGAGGE